MTLLNILITKVTNSLYCGVVYVDPNLGCIGKRRKVMPTAAERLVWAQGSPSTLRAVVATINGVRVTLAAAICWESYMPLLRYSLYSQNVNLYLAPTADARETWLPLMQTVALEGRTFVVSANQCIRRNQLPGWIVDGTDQTKILQHEMSEIEWPEKDGPKESVDLHVNGAELRKVQSAMPNSTHADGSTSVRVRRKSIIPVDNNHELHLPLIKDGPTAPVSHYGAETSSHKVDPGSEFVCRGGSCIVSPAGTVLAGPLWETQTTLEDPDNALLIQEIDLEDCIRGRLDFDAAGSYSRNDSFRLSVEGLNLDPLE